MGRPDVLTGNELLDCEGAGVGFLMAAVGAAAPPLAGVAVLDPVYSDDVNEVMVEKNDDIVLGGASLLGGGRGGEGCNWRCEADSGGASLPSRIDCCVARMAHGGAGPAGGGGGVREAEELATGR